MTGQQASAIRDAAAAWVARMDAGAWDEREEAELQAWLARDARHPGALLQMQAAWMTLDRPAPASGLRGKDDVPAEPARQFRRRTLLAAGAAAIAASVVGMIAWQESATSYTTEVGEIRRVPLADGSVATINTASAVKVRLADNRRHVRLDQGEAWFQVAKDRQRPFVVEAGPVRVEAVGTAFSVRRFDDGAEILVTEGVVEAWIDGAEGHRVRLAAGQRAFVGDNAAIRREPAPPSSVDRMLAWRAGKIDLVGESLADAVSEFNRYNQRHIILADAAIGGEQFDGVFQVDDPEGFAIAVHSALGVPLDLSSPEQIRIGDSHR